MTEKKVLTAKEYLEQLEEIDISINQECERLDEMKLNATCTGAIDYAKDRVQTSPANILERRVCNYIDYEEMLNKRIDQFVDAKEKIISQIRGLHHKHYINLLYKKYVQYKELKQIAVEMKMSRSYIIELHKKALQAFDETYSNLHYLT